MGASLFWPGAPEHPRYRVSFGAIDACPTLEALAALGKRLYALALTPDQAGVAWSHYHLRKQALEALVVLGRPAPALLAAVEQASPTALGRVGARLYRTQHAGARTVTGQEWRPARRGPSRSPPHEEAVSHEQRQPRSDPGFDRWW